MLLSLVSRLSPELEIANGFGRCCRMLLISFLGSILFYIQPCENSIFMSTKTLPHDMYV